VLQGAEYAEDRVRQLVTEKTQGRLAGCSRTALNVLALNLALDAAASKEPSSVSGPRTICYMANQRRDLEKRPSPDALSEAAREKNDQAGRPNLRRRSTGVGKTYEMLQSAHAN